MILQSHFLNETEVWLLASPKPAYPVVFAAALTTMLQNLVQFEID
jgi:hypothetical protein